MSKEEAKSRKEQTLLESDVYEESEPTWELHDGQLSCVELGITTIPSEVLPQSASITALYLPSNSINNTDFLQHFVNLKLIVLDNNRISALHATFPNSPKLTTLSLNKNQIADLEALLDTLSGKTPTLHHLSLIDNPVCPLVGQSADQKRRIRVRCIFRLGAQLKFIDSVPVTDAERSEAKNSGQFMKVTRVAVQQQEIAVENKTKDYFKQDESREGKHTAYIGVSRSQYTGKTSEGNRFIVDTQL
jgi:hypothetical protein